MVRSVQKRFLTDCHLWCDIFIWLEFLLLTFEIFKKILSFFAFGLAHYRRCLDKIPKAHTKTVSLNRNVTPLPVIGISYRVFILLCKSISRIKCHNRIKFNAHKCVCNIMILYLVEFLNARTDCTTDEDLHRLIRLNIFSHEILSLAAKT